MSDVDNDEAMLSQDVLSQKLTNALPSIMHADFIEKKALLVLNSPQSFTEYPRKSGAFWNVKFTFNGCIICDCKGFR